MGQAEMLTWYGSLHPLKVDVVGDFAGKELFAIHGDSMLLHCITKAKVDYDYGFQLLHAIHAVETFLDNLKRRGCKFHVIWFDDHEELCVPTSAKQSERFLLTRAVLIKHLARHGASGGGKVSFQFPSMESAGYDQYLKENAIHFFLCLNGRTIPDALERAKGMQYLGIVYRFGLRGYSVSFLDTLEFVSSKVYVSVVSPSSTQWSSVKIREHTPMGRESFKKLCDLENGENQAEGSSSPWGDNSPTTARDMVSLTALSNMLLIGPDTHMKRALASYIVHLAVMRVSNLSQRSLNITHLEKEEQARFDNFVGAFCLVCKSVIEDDKEAFSAVEWDVSDLIDGRILRRVFHEPKSLQIPHGMMAGPRQYAQRLLSLTSVDVSEYLPQGCSVEEPVVCSRNIRFVDENTFPILPFENSVLKSYLEDVYVDTADSPGLGTTDKVFREISHWHNAKTPIDPKHYQKPKDVYALKKNQRRMAATVAYSASLTNSAGKVITPETIVVAPPDDPKGKKNRNYQKPKQAVQNKQAGPRGGKAKSGHIRALEESRNIEQAKRDAKAKGAMVAWQSRCAEFEAEDNLVKRFMKTTRYISGLTPVDSEAVGAEASLYAINALAKILLKQRSGKGDMRPLDFDILALIQKIVLETKSGSASSDVTKEFAAAAKAVGLPPPFTSNLSSDEALPFYSILSERFSQIKITNDPLEFQLKHCGPYLDRGFDPTPDPRVRFTPDSWQTKVLDTIDADKSLLVIAPTSSGKTFISFYAMKKVLQSSDDGVLVYVAPTKALVNQVAAEIQAEFSKSYKHPAKSVWAIHTRDYRVNNTTGCQILVTVPHILEIMLLAPTNSKSRDSWARRVKRIIFDEVHCIGQAEDGVVWEHLLLLAPCPIVALSATVGNPMEFKAWLEASQKMKGFELEMVVHSSRYSDLRKFIYFPPDEYTFDGVKPAGKLPVPGIEPIPADVVDKCGSRFAFIHPISSLTNRSRDTLEDIGLEPRDCLELWECMVKHQTKQYPVADSLHPGGFVTKVVKKADVVKWGAALKDVLRKWMKDVDSPFSAVQKDLQSSIEAALDIGTVRGFSATRTTFETSSDALCSTALPLLNDLHSQGALPAILFNYDRGYCEKIAFSVLARLEKAEQRWKESSREWEKKMAEYNDWKNDASRRDKISKKQLKADAGASKMDMVREAASKDVHPMESFNPEAPLPIFSFADHSKLLPSELEKYVESLEWLNLHPSLIQCLRRGIGVHHAGMNRGYRQVVEMLFRKGFLTAVIATGTLALGINMPCKTVVFFGDSVFLTALNYQQGAGRSGRRGFDQLGNVVFTGMEQERVFEVMSSRLPDLQGHFPLSTTLILRLMGLLHHTENSEYAVNALYSIFSQTRLYLGGPSGQMAIKHHVRFSIEYLRRQNLLTREGVPLNFAGLVGHLYFTENSVFAFHSLLREGYFYEVCRDIRHKPREVLLELMLVLSHLFCRHPVRNYEDKKFLEDVVHRSTSEVLLRALPCKAEKILRAHNAETLGIFTTYVRTYVQQHLSDTQDDTLPFTKQKVGRQEGRKYDVSSILRSLPPTKLRSPFVALSGSTDKFDSIQDLCDTVRSGVFLEESAIPYIRIYPDDTDGVPWNAYIYDFFKHGNMQALVSDNGIKSGDVWFHLKDFSLILATVMTSIANYFSLEPTADDAMMDVQDAGDVISDEPEAPDKLDGDVSGKAARDVKARAVPVPKKAPKAVVADSWEDEMDSSSDEAPASSGSAGDESSGEQPKRRIEDNDLMLVLMAFRKLQGEFDEKFKKVWA